MPRTNSLIAGTAVPVVIGLAVAAGSSQAATGATDGSSLTASPGLQDGGALQFATCGPCNPCSLCAAGAATSSDCLVPRLAATYNSCNPCAAGEEVELTAAEAGEAYACIGAVMAEGYARSGNRWADSYRSWRNVAARPHVSDTHGARYVNNDANDIGADNYALFEEAGFAPVGTALAEDSFSVTAAGKVGAGPLLLMEKMEAGFDPDTGDWRYALIMRTAGRAAPRAASAQPESASAPTAASVSTTGTAASSSTRSIASPRRHPRPGALLRTALQAHGDLDCGCEPGLCSVPRLTGNIRSGRSPCAHDTSSPQPSPSP